MEGATAKININDSTVNQTTTSNTEDVDVKRHTNSTTNHAYKTNSIHSKQRESLPMYLYHSNLLSTIRQNPVTVLCGETGCGKTTLCPQYILEEALENNSKEVNIICTQPRRVAAMSVAERVAEEFGCKTRILFRYLQ